MTGPSAPTPTSPGTGLRDREPRLGRSPDEDRLLDEDEMITWPDNNPEDWFYADMQEATNSHDYTWVTVSGDKVEKWTEKLEQRDWAALEHAWSTAHSAPGGEVTK